MYNITNNEREIKRNIYAYLLVFLIVWKIIFDYAGTWNGIAETFDVS